MLFRPARTAAQDIPDVKIICDFDALISEKIGFKFKNKRYVVNSVSVENYMKVTLAYKSLMGLISSRSQGEVQDQEIVYQKYFDLINPLVPDFSYKDLKELSFVLLNQLVSLILRQIAGDPDLYKKDEKKNPLNLNPL